MKFIDSLKKQARTLKLEAEVLMIAYKDERTPLLAKVLIWITVGYLLSPIDLIPDFIPVLGWLDDLIIVPLLIKASLSLLPEDVVLEARQKEKAMSVKHKKPNWLAATVIILVWMVAVIWIFSKIRLL